MLGVGCERQVVWIHIHIGDKTHEADFILSQVLKDKWTESFVAGIWRNICETSVRAWWDKVVELWVVFFFDKQKVL